MTIALMPFTYPITCVLKGKRREQVQWLLDEIPVEIVEVEADAAPEHLVLDMRSAQDRHLHHVLARRIYKGRPMLALGAPFITTFGVNGRATVQGDGFALDNLEESLALIRRPRARISWSDYPFDLSRATEMGRENVRNGLPWTNEFEARSVSASQRDAYLAEASLKLDHMIAIEGRIWIEAPEPTWKVWLPSICETPFAPKIELQYFQTTYDADTFRGDRLADAIAYARTVSGREPVIYGRIEGSDLIEWSAPEASSFARRESARTVELADSSGVTKLPASFFAPFCRIRDRLKVVREFSLDHVRRTIDDMTEIDWALRAAEPEVQELTATRLLRWAIGKDLAHSRTLGLDASLAKVDEADLEAMSAAFGR